MIASDTESPARPFPVMSWVIAVWVVLAVAGLGTALVRMYRGRGR